MFVPRWYQEQAVSDIFQFFTENAVGNPICAMPTGTGKSGVIGTLMRRAMGWWPNQRFLVLTHVKELIQQDFDELLGMWPNAPAGIFSAQLGRKEWSAPIVFGGVASVKNAVDAIGRRDIVMIDECHLLSPREDSMYQEIISRLKTINPFLRVVGFSASPFRMRQGRLTEPFTDNKTGLVIPPLFTDFSSDMCSVDWFARFIAEGFLVQLVAKRTKTEIDTSKVGMVAGEFNQKQLGAAVTDDLSWHALNEACQLGEDRKSWLTFCAGVDHAVEAARMLNMLGVRATCVHSKMSVEERDDNIRGFKEGWFRAITNNNILTTGFNHRPIDLILMLRPTMSPGLWVQMLGRGTRPSPETGKRDCLCLDYARNARRLGPINDPAIPSNNKNKKPGDAPVKLCEDCGSYNHTSARVCIGCGATFDMTPKIFKSADVEAEVMRVDTPDVKVYAVTNVTYYPHLSKRSGNLSLRVTYYSGLKPFTQYVSIENNGPAGRLAREWWHERSPDEPPKTVEDALDRASWLRVPKKVRIWTNAPVSPEVIGYEW